MKETILVTGGAGYIGSQNCKLLAKHDFIPVTYDNFSEGNRYAVKWGPLVEGDIRDEKKLSEAITDYKPKAVMHFAANAVVAESILNPQKYYNNNVLGTIALLNAMLKHDIKYLIFSSSCATYGNAQFSPITEDHPQSPISAYGKSKYMIEQILQDYDRAYGLKHITLRYFNAAGADFDLDVGEDRKLETHLIPLAIDTAFGIYPELNVYGYDFETKDGSAVRDYIHTADLAQGHIKALCYLLDKKQSLCINLGSENGYSVLEIVKEIEKLTRKKIKVSLSKKRMGDPPILYANSRLAKKILGWEPKFSDLNTIINSAIKWHKKKNLL